MNLNLKHSDSDGYDDAQEAFLGTDPGSDESYLEMTGLYSNDGDVITWDSVPERVYAIEIGRLQPNFTLTGTISNITASAGATISITNTPPGPPDRIYRVKATGLTQ